jgi:hypothetical protein
LRLILSSLVLMLFGMRTFAQPAIVDCRVEALSNLRACQQVVGSKEIEIRLKEFLGPFGLDYETFRELLPTDPAVRKVLNSQELSEWVESKPLRVIAVSDEELRVIDGHHMARILYLLGKQEAKVIVYYDEALLELSEDEIWNLFRQNGWIHLRDRDRNSIHPHEIPRFIGDLNDDPFRSLAWMLKKLKVFKKTGVSFQEFIWADFLHSEFAEQGLDFDFSTPKGYRDALKESVEIIARKPEVLELPGKRSLAPSELRGRCAEFIEKHL